MKAKCGTKRNPHNWHLTAYDRIYHVATRCCAKCRIREYINYYIKPVRGRRKSSVLAGAVN